MYFIERSVNVDHRVNVDDVVNVLSSSSSGPLEPIIGMDFEDVEDAYAFHKIDIFFHSEKPYLKRGEKPLCNKLYFLEGRFYKNE